LRQGVAGAPGLQQLAHAAEILHRIPLWRWLWVPIAIGRKMA
jgi:hypothetical protein